MAIIPQVKNITTNIAASFISFCRFDTIRLCEEKAQIPDIRGIRKAPRNSQVLGIIEKTICEWQKAGCDVFKPIACQEFKEKRARVG